MGKVEAGSERVNRSGATLADIVTAVKRVTGIIAEIAAASGEQSSGIDQVTKAVMQMDQVVQSNAAQTEELLSTAHSLAAHAVQVQALVGRFKLGAGARALPPWRPGGRPPSRPRRRRHRSGGRSPRRLSPARGRPAPTPAASLTTTSRNSRCFSECLDNTAAPGTRSRPVGSRRASRRGPRGPLRRRGRGGRR